MGSWHVVVSIWEKGIEEVGFLETYLLIAIYYLLRPEVVNG